MKGGNRNQDGNTVKRECSKVKSVGNKGGNTNNASSKERIVNTSVYESKVRLP